MKQPALGIVIAVAACLCGTPLAAQSDPPTEPTPQAAQEGEAARADLPAPIEDQLARLGWRLSAGLRLVAAVYNLRDAEVSDIEHFYESRSDPNGPVIEDVHFHPAEPRAVRLALEWNP